VAAEALRLCPSLSVLRLAGAGHGFHRDRFSPFVAGLRAFLDRVHASESSG
jgi:hypothetical protein